MLEALIGPTSSRSRPCSSSGPWQTGRAGNQDSYYNPHPPRFSLRGLDRDRRLRRAQWPQWWFATGSQHEPVYPPHADAYGFGNHDLEGITPSRASPIPMTTRTTSPHPHRQSLRPSPRAGNGGDVWCSSPGHVLHRSKQNWTTDRFRHRSSVTTAMPPASFTQWGGDDEVEVDPVTDPPTAITSLLARYAPRLRPAALRHLVRGLMSPEERKRASEYAAMMMGDMDTGMMGATDCRSHPRRRPLIRKQQASRAGMPAHK